MPALTTTAPCLWWQGLVLFVLVWFETKSHVAQAGLKFSSH